MGLSVAMITLNEEKILSKTLKSVAEFADEIIIVDSGSTDRTKEIAEEFGAKFIHQKWLGYGMQRNKAIDSATNEWILNIDADEEISPKLKEKIIKIKNGEEEGEVFSINFTSVCFGKKLKHGGWSNSYHIRLFKKDAGRFNDNMVHEEFKTDKKVYFLKEDILHHSYLTLQDYFIKFNIYTTEGAIDYYKKGKKASIFQIVFNPIYKFIKMYIIRLGFLDGIEGLMIACASAMYSMVKYFKLREIYKNGVYYEDNNIKNR
ncbi:glycosyltransferase family 2 protein [Fusobacterium sp.]|uniref:glycosyltransferase family 2 protein n=1 Tax=Fusobacterium sp. TaxID=68766 RepID=UPI0026393CFA|nr:glycosyltransferase family 2 protein [Fusobacterium sp.]